MAATNSGFIVHSFAGDDPLACKDHVRKLLGMDPFKANGHAKPAKKTYFTYHDETGAIIYQVAFVRLAWREACRLMDVPLIWKSIAAVEGELFSGLLRLEPADPWPGDKIEFVMPGPRAEALIADAGIALPNILAQHECGPECVRPSHTTSRKWREYLQAWAAEEPKNAA
jgi:hypothetical protein